MDFNKNTNKLGRIQTPKFSITYIHDLDKKVFNLLQLKFLAMSLSKVVCSFEFDYGVYFLCGQIS